MIRAEVSPSAAAFAARLSAKARVLAAARLEDRRRALSADPARWRSARLLWPLLGER